MYILYIFKFRKINKKILNCVKRRFYYNYKKINNILVTNLFRKDQIFLVKKQNEELIDKFLKEYTDWIEYYKINVNNIEFISKKEKTADV